MDPRIQQINDLIRRHVHTTSGLGLYDEAELDALHQLTRTAGPDELLILSVTDLLTITGALKDWQTMDPEVRAQWESRPWDVEGVIAKLEAYLY